MFTVVVALCAGVVFLGVLINLATSSSSSGLPAPAAVRLQATSSFTGTHILVDNAGTDDGRDVKLEINGGLYEAATDHDYREAAE